MNKLLNSEMVSTGGVQTNGWSRNRSRWRETFSICQKATDSGKHLRASTDWKSIISDQSLFFCRLLRTTPEGLTLASCVLTSDELTVPLGDGYTTMFCVFGKVSVQHDLFELEEWDTMLITRSSVMTRGQLLMKAIGDRAVVLMVYTPAGKRFENRMGWMLKVDMSTSLSIWNLKYSRI